MEETLQDEEIKSDVEENNDENDDENDEKYMTVDEEEARIPSSSTHTTSKLKKWSKFQTQINTNVMLSKIFEQVTEITSQTSSLNSRLIQLESNPIFESMNQQYSYQWVVY